MNSSCKILMDVFLDSDDEEEREMRDKVNDLFTVPMLQSKHVYTTPHKVQQPEQSTTIKFTSSKIKEVRTYLQPPRIEVTLANSQLETQLNETFEYVKLMGVVDRANVTQAQAKIASLRKLVTQLVESYFTNLTRQLERIVNNPSLCSFKDGLLMELLQMKRMMNEQPAAVSSRLLNIKNLIKQKEQDTPKQLFAKLDLAQLAILQETLPRLIHIDNKEELSIPQISCRQKVLLKTQSEIRITEDIFVYHAKANSFYHVNTAKPQEFKQFDCGSPDVPLPDICSLIHVPECKQLIMVGNAMIVDGQHIEPSNRILKYSLLSKSFSQGAMMPASMVHSQVAHRDHYVYVWGGKVKIDDQFLYSKRGFKYNLICDKWSPLASMKYPRIHGVICNVGNKLFLIGGMQNLRLPNKLIEIYNTTSEQFEPPLSIINEMSFTPPIKGFAIQVSQREILLFGGYTQNRTEAYTQIIDINACSVQLGSSSFDMERYPCITQPAVLDSKPLIMTFSNGQLFQYEISPAGAKLSFSFGV